MYMYMYYSIWLLICSWNKIVDDFQMGERDDFAIQKESSYKLIKLS